jgi:hypothetical protein
MADYHLPARSLKAARREYPLTVLEETVQTLDLPLMMCLHFPEGLEKFQKITADLLL